MKLLDTTPQLFAPEKAAELVGLLNSTEDACGWTYVVDMPEGARFARIEIRDEGGDLVGWL